ncbi:MAG: sulfatase-like hydrolase/transferase [Fibrobacteres bacterium]|nr:sulfatase-like hydrolase/transferase [Fibrobacterota bacterium]
MMRRLIHYLLSLITVPLLLVAVDVTFRHNVVFYFTVKEYLFYAVSFLFSIFIYLHVLQLLQYLKARTGNRFILFVAVFGFSLIYAVLIVLTYGYYLSVGVMPNYFTFEFILQEGYNALIIARDSFTIGMTVLLLLAIAIISALIIISIKNFAFKWTLLRRMTIGTITIILLFVFNNNVRFVDQCFVPDVNSLSFIGRNFYNMRWAPKLGSSGLLARNRHALNEKHNNPGFNLLLIVGESLRSRNMSLYGYPIETTPFLSKLKNDNPDELFVFERHYTNSTATLLSYPTFHHGISPIQSSALFHSSPTLFEYAKTMNYSTFLVSSHDYDFYNFRSYFRSDAIDYFWEKEKSGEKAVNDLGIEDTSAMEEALSVITDLLSNEKRFCGIIHLNTNHYPYNTPQRFKKWGPERNQLYDNTILCQDYIIERLFNLLQEKNALNNTVVVFVSDHGEGFQEHGFIGHRGFYYSELIQIPLILYLPNRLQNGYNVANLRENQKKNTQNIDLIPTFLSLLGLDTAAEIKKLNKNFMGSSLLGKIDGDRNIFIVNNNSIARYREGLSLVRGDYHYQYLLNRKTEQEELFNIAVDAFEKKNLWHDLSDSIQKSYRNPFYYFEQVNSLLPGNRTH